MNHAAPGVIARLSEQYPASAAYCGGFSYRQLDHARRRGGDMPGSGGRRVYSIEDVRLLVLRCKVTEAISNGLRGAITSALNEAFTSARWADGDTVEVSASDAVSIVVQLPADVWAELAPDQAVTLEACVCDECVDCPDGWHSDAEMPCSCTPDCALTEEGS